jgi:prepilin-type N-terminal cleavage/methylation domain-containing protein
MKCTNSEIAKPALKSNIIINTQVETSICTRVPIHSRLWKNTLASRCKGFSIMELMIGVTVAAIMLATATPSISQFRANNQLSAANNSIVTGLNLARFSAVTRGGNVLVCPSADSVSCSHGSWYQGWIVFNENGASNNADAFTPAVADIIRVGTYGVGTDSGLFRSDPAFTLSIVYDPDGTTTSGTVMSIDLCHSVTKYAKKYSQISISPFGFVSTQSVASACSS